MKITKSSFFLGIIIVLGIILRLNYDTFLNGYNFDEFAIISIAKLNFPFEILKHIALEDYHAPLYYLVAHFFSNSENTELHLRILNILFSAINIFYFYRYFSQS